MACIPGHSSHATTIVDNGFVAFAGGIPDQSKHDNNGPTLSFKDAGEYFKDSDILDYPADYEAWNNFHKTHRITGSGRPCSKCGQPFSPPMF